MSNGARGAPYTFKMSSVLQRRRHGRELAAHRGVDDFITDGNPDAADQFRVDADARVKPALKARLELGNQFLQRRLIERERRGDVRVLHALELVLQLYEQTPYLRHECQALIVDQHPHEIFLRVRKFTSHVERQLRERLRREFGVGDAQMQACIADPKLSPQTLTQLSLDVAGKLSDTQKNFVRVLVDNERLALVPEIRSLFVQLKNEFEGVQDAHITSAFALDEPALKKLIAELEPRFQCRLNPSVSVDPELIGGVRVAVGDEVIDASVRGKLAAMATALKN